MIPVDCWITFDRIRKTRKAFINSLTRVIRFSAFAKMRQCPHNIPLRRNQIRNPSVAESGLKSRYLSYFCSLTPFCAVPVTTTDVERSSVIIEALCAEGYRWSPRFFRVVLKENAGVDEETIKMLEIITTPAHQFCVCIRQLIRHLFPRFSHGRQEQEGLHFVL